jgi:histidine triad (HIT) family protein
MEGTEMAATQIPVANCVFCRIVAGAEPATIVRRTPEMLTIVPLNPVVPGHLLILPTVHVEDFTTRPSVSAAVMHEAANVAVAWALGSCNLITSKGHAATQSMFHLHVHLVPRVEGDGLMLPWTKIN